MVDRPPASAEPLVDADAPTIPWSEARDRLAEGHSFWIATPRRDGWPHARPVLTVWVDGALHTTTNPTTGKGRNLARDGRCTIMLATDGLDLVVEGTATRVTNDDALQRVAEAYASKYAWPVVARDGAFHAEWGAPTAGPPPYVVYTVTPTVVYGFGTDETFAPRSTRWRF